MLPNSNLSLKDYNHVFLKQWDTGVPHRKVYDGIKVINDISHTETNTIIHLLALEEASPDFYTAWLSNLERSDYLSYMERLKERNIFITAYVGSGKVGYRNRFLDRDLSQYDNHTIEYDPLFWIKNQFSQYAEILDPNNGPNDDQDYFLEHVLKNKKTKIDRLFMCLNGAPRWHRQEILEAIFKNNLWDKGYITYFGTRPQYSYYEIYNNNYSSWFKTTHVLSSTKNIPRKDRLEPSFYQCLFPSEVRKCLLHVITETDADLFFLTEKTAIPLMLGKPILVLGSQHFHRTLKSLGFVLHPEIDYSFDNKPDLGDRIQGIIVNLKRFEDQDYEKLYEKMYPVCSYNSRHLAKLIQHNPTPISEKVYNRLRLFDLDDNPYSLKNLKSKYGDNSIPTYYSSYRDAYKWVLPEPAEKLRSQIAYAEHFPIRLK